jgi:Seven Residue Repeat
MIPRRAIVHVRDAYDAIVQVRDAYDAIVRVRDAYDVIVHVRDAYDVIVHVRDAYDAIVHVNVKVFFCSSNYGPADECLLTTTTIVRQQRTLRLSGGLEHNGVHRLACRFSRPDHELKSRVIALASIERTAERRLALPVRHRNAADQQHGMAKHHHSALRPNLEMADPQLLIDGGDEPLHFGKACFRHFHFERAGKVQDLDVVHPAERDLVVGSAAADRERDLVIDDAIEWPVVAAGNAFDHFKRIVAQRWCMADEGHLGLQLCSSAANYSVVGVVMGSFAVCARN